MAKPTTVMSNNSHTSEKILEINQRIAQVLRIGRKMRDLNQVEFAQILGISQSFVSKLEKGLMIPDAVLWQNFCDLVSIPYSAMKFGYLDGQQSQRQITALYESFSLDKRFQDNATICVRSFRPLVSAWITTLGADSLKKFLKKKCYGLDVDYFGIFYAKANFVLFEMIMQGLQDEVKQEKKFQQILVTAYAQIENHGEVFRGVDLKTSSTENLISRFLSQLKNYDTALVLGIFEEKNGNALVELDVKMTNLFHFESTKFEEMTDRYVQSKILQLNGVASFNGEHENVFTLVEKKKSSQGLKCILQLKRA